MKSIAKASILSERAILQTIAIDGRCMDELEGLAVEDFAHPGHQALFRLAQDLDSKRQLTSDAWHAEAMAAGDAITSVFTDVIVQDLGVGTTANLGYHVHQVREHALTRRIADTAGGYLGKLRSDELGGTELLDEFSRALLGLEREKPGEVLTVRELIKRRMEEHDQAMAAMAEGKTVGYIPTGIDGLDERAFLREGIVTALAARPGMGKSALAQNIACAAADAAAPVHYFSLEDGESSFTDRMLAVAAMGRIGLTAQRSHQLSKVQLAELVRTGTQIIERRDKFLLFSSLVGKTARDCIAIARRSMRTHKTRLVVIDYLQKLRSPDSRMSKFEAYGANCSDLEDAAKAHGWAVLALCQVKREVEQRTDKRPRIEDIYGSDEITQSVKAGLGVYRPWVYDRNADEREMELIGIKYNDGPAHWSLRVGWDGPTTRVYPWPD